MSEPGETVLSEAALSETVLTVENLRVTFRSEDGDVRAVRGLSYELARGETLAVVGESGSGKSVTHMALMDLLPGTALISADRLRLVGRNLLEMSAKDKRHMRGADMAMIFQDPMSSLNPFSTVGTQIAEMLKLHRGLRGKALYAAAVQALSEVGIPNAQARVEQYPHEFSGGMRQRAMIAMMLAGEPRVLIADEPTTALDVTVQAQIMDLLATLQRERGMSIILITHDLGLVAGSSHRVAVMYAGRIVEMGTTEEIFADPRHPYTRGLLASVPRLDQEGGTLYQIPGTPPDLAHLPLGCPFRERCEFTVEDCGSSEPGLAECRPEHSVACHVKLDRFAATGEKGTRKEGAR